MLKRLNTAFPQLVVIDGGASDAIEDGKSGKICDGNNLDEIYSNINELLNK